MSISAPLNNRPHPSGSRASPPARDTSVNHAPRNSVNSFSSAPSPPPGVNQYPPMQHPAPRPTGKRPMAPAPIMPSPFPPLSVAIPPPPTSPQVGKRRRVSQKWGSLINNLLAAVAQQTPGEQDGKGSESPAAIPDSPGSLMALTSDVASELGSKIAALRKGRFSMGSAREMQIMRVTTNQQYWNSTWSVRTDCCNPILLQNQSKPFRRADELVSIHLQTPEPVTASVSVWVQNPLRERRVLLEGEFALPTSLYVDLNKRAVPDQTDRFFAACAKSKRRAERAFMLGVAVAAPQGQCNFSTKIDVRAAWRIPDPATLLSESASGSALESSIMKACKESVRDAARSEALEESQADSSEDKTLESEGLEKKEAKRPGLSCHQCKGTPIYFANCTGVQKGRKCKKHYCFRCIHKHRDLYSDLLATIGANGQAEPTLGAVAPTWACPSCRGVCMCATCRRRRFQDQAGGLPRGVGSLSSLAAAVVAVAGDGKDDEETEDEQQEEEDERVAMESESAGIPDDDYISFDEDSEDEAATPGTESEAQQAPLVPAEFHEHADWEECHCYADLLNNYDAELGPKGEEFMMEGTSAGLPLLDQYLCEAFTAAAVTALAKARAVWPKGKRFRGQLEPLGTAMTEAALFESVATADLGKFIPFPRKYEEKPHKSQEKTVLKQLFTPKLVNALENKGLKSALMRLGLQIPKNKAMMKEILLRVGQTGTRDGEVKARPRGRPMGSFKQPVRKAKWQSSSPIGTASPPSS